MYIFRHDWCEFNCEDVSHSYEVRKETLEEARDEMLPYFDDLYCSDCIVNVDLLGRKAYIIQFLKGRPKQIDIFTIRADRSK